MTVEELTAAPARRHISDDAREASAERTRSIAIDIVLCVVLFAIAMAPRAAWIAYNDRPPQGLNDPVMYNLFGDIIADGDGYMRPVLVNCPTKNSCPFAYYPVGYPASLAGLKKAGDLVGYDRDILSIKMANGVYGAITVVLIFLLASRLMDRRTGVVAAGILAFFPSQILYTGTLLSEPLFTMLLVASVVALAWHPWRREGMPYGQLALAGLILSAATMTRGITLVFPLLLLVLWLFYLDSKKRALLQAGVLFAGIAVLVVPWTARNIVQFDTLVGPSTNLGDDLCIGNHAGADGKFTITGKCFEGFEGLAPHELEIQRNREGLKIGIQDRLADPLGTPLLVAQKAYWLLYKDDDGLWAAESYGYDYFITHPRREVIQFAANSYYYAAGVLVLLGMTAFALSKDLRRAFVLLAMLYVLAVPLAFFGDPRFHYPAIPFATVIAGATIVWLWDRRRSFEGEET